MNKLIIALTSIGLTACIGSRPYDGAIGYKTQTTPSGILITDIEQSSTKTETMLQRMKTICAKQLSTEESKVHICIVSETTYKKIVDMNVPVPIGVRDTGSKARGMNGGPILGSISTYSGGGMASITQTDKVQRNMKVREITVSCSI